jgi:biopolymer transport protein ExbD
MDFSGRMGGVRHRPRQEINLVPFIDILLVLLVIFIVASPVLTHAVKLDLPRVSSRAERRDRDEIRLSVLADGTVLWDGAIVPDSSLSSRLRAESGKTDPPGVRLSADARASYESVARVLGASARAGLSRISFVSLPASRP